MSIVKTEPNVNNCPECGANITTDKGEAFCSNCGLVVEEDLPNQRSGFNPLGESKNNELNETGPGRKADSNILHDKGLGSQISFKNKDASGNRIANKKRVQMNRIRRWQRAYQFDSHDNRARKSISEMLRYANAMDVGEETVQMAGQLFSQAHDTDVATGRSMDGLADAVVYLSAKQTNHNRSWDEWVENANVAESMLKTMVSAIKQELELGFMPDKASDYAPQTLNEIYITDENRKETFDLLDAVEENLNHIGRKPQAYVAASIYLASKYITQKEVADASNTTSATVRKALKDMKELDITTGHEYYE